MNTKLLEYIQIDYLLELRKISFKQIICVLNDHLKKYLLKSDNKYLI